MQTSVEASERTRRLLQAWASVDPDAVSNYYLDDATHRGPGVLRFLPDAPGATLHARADIRRRVAALAPVAGLLTYQVTWVQETDSASVVEYEVRVGSDEPKFSVDVVEWVAARVCCSRSYVLAIAD